MTALLIYLWATAAIAIMDYKLSYFWKKKHMLYAFTWPVGPIVFLLTAIPRRKR